MNAKQVSIKPPLCIDDGSFSLAKLIANDLPTGKPTTPTVDTKCCTLHPQSRRFQVTIDTNNENLDKELAALLHLHAIGLPLLISFDSLDTNYYKRYTPGVFGVFHCPRCLASWQRTNQLRSRCHEGARFIQGPKFPLSTTDATKLLSLFQWSKKFASTSLLQALPSLRQVFNEEETTSVLNSVHHMQSIFSNKDESKFSSPEISALKRKRNREMVTKVAYYLRRYLFSAAPAAATKLVHTKHPTASFSDDSSDRINLVGMRSSDGSFYPGFFSYKQFFVQHYGHKGKRKTSQKHSILSAKRELLPNLPFVATGSFDNEGFYQSYDQDAAKISDLDQLPSLHEAIASQPYQPSASNDSLEKQLLEPELNKTEAVFCFQGGSELKLSEVFASGIWQTGGENEYFVAGVFDGQGHFKAAYCITEHGFLIPGTTNDRRKFYPMCKYADNGNVSASFSTSDLTDNLHKVFGELLTVLRFPHASEFRRKDTLWKCVRNGTITDDPACITVRSDGLFADTESLNIYIGGELTPEGQLHLFGKHDDNGKFLPGAPPVLTDTLIQELTNDITPTSYVIEEFSRRFGLRLNKVPSIMQSTTTMVLSDYKCVNQNEYQSRGKVMQDSDRRKAISDDHNQMIKLQLLRNKKLKDIHDSVRRSGFSFAVKLPGMEPPKEPHDDPMEEQQVVFSPCGTYAPPKSSTNSAVKNIKGKHSTKSGILIQAYFSTPYGESSVAKLEYEAAERLHAKHGSGNSYALPKDYMEGKKIAEEGLHAKKGPGKSYVFPKEYMEDNRTAAEKLYAKHGSDNSYVLPKDYMEGKRIAAERVYAKNGSGNNYLLSREYMDGNRTSTGSDYDAYTNRYLHSTKYTDIVRRGIIIGEVNDAVATRKKSSKPKSDQTTSLNTDGRKSIEKDKPEKEKKAWLIRKRAAEGKSEGDHVKPSMAPHSLSRVEFKDIPSVEFMVKDSKKPKKSKKRKSDFSGEKMDRKSGVRSLPLQDQGRYKRQSSLQSGIVPNSVGLLSNLNFTKSYSFSYFEVPRYVKEHNKKIAEGKIHMPTLQKTADSSLVDLVKAN